MNGLEWTLFVFTVFQPRILFISWQKDGQKDCEKDAVNGPNIAGYAGLLVGENAILPDRAGYRQGLIQSGINIAGYAGLW